MYNMCECIPMETAGGVVLGEPGVRLPLPR